MVAEKNRVWRCFGSLPTMRRMSWMKPMSSMRSASSRTKISTVSRLTARSCTRSSSRPGVATRTSTPLAMARICLPIGTPPMASVTATFMMPAIGLEAVDDLAGQFSRRAQHQDAAALALGTNAILRQVIEDRQREGRGLAGPGLRNADDVAAGEHMRDGLGLDRGGGLVAFFDDGAGDGLSESEFKKSGQKICSFMQHDRPARFKGTNATRGVQKTSRVVRAAGEFGGERRAESQFVKMVFVHAARKRPEKGQLRCR